MIRSILSYCVCGFVLAIGLSTTFVSVRNAERAESLAALQRQMEMLEAYVEQLDARGAAYVTPEGYPELDPMSDWSRLSMEQLMLREAALQALLGEVSH